MTNQQKATHWVKQIDRALENDTRFRKWSSAVKILSGIKETIQQTGTVTEGQIQAIKNIRHGKNEID